MPGRKRPVENSSARNREELSAEKAVNSIFDMKKRKALNHAECAAAAMFLAAVLPFASFAESPEFARTQEQWALLRDDTLEWAEIPDLIREYNATVKANQAEYSEDQLRAKNAQQTSDSLVRMAEEYESLADASENEEMGAVSAATYRLLADQLRSKADDNVSDYRVILLGYERVEMQTVQNAENLFLSYHRAVLSKEQNAAQVAYLQREYQSALNRQKNGLGTEIETLTALENLQKARAESVTGDSGINTAYRKLITLCGWKFDASPVIGACPSESAGFVLPADRDADQKTALENSLTLREDAIKVENAVNLYGGSVEKKWKDQTAADTDTVKTAFNTAYDAMRLAKDSYDSALAQYRVRENGRAAAEKQLSLGVISGIEYARSVNAAQTAKASKDNAWLELLSKKAAYDAVVQGLS